ncbi:MAG: hypothetical protein CL914_14270 [Deltaproteobacteria bacterium]|nr:hypothetical protein [Deltaproteobacteria bacterium]MBP43285.1 hypothetical protein [Deltaproteobacteria bacterium]
MRILRHHKWEKVSNTGLFLLLSGAKFVKYSPKLGADIFKRKIFFMGVINYFLYCVFIFFGECFKNASFLSTNLVGHLFID